MWHAVQHRETSSSVIVVCLSLPFLADLSITSRLHLTNAQGVPETKNDLMAQSPDHYFEYHIQVTTKAAVAAGAVQGNISAEDDKHLIEVAKELQQTLGVQVPVSWNAFKVSSTAFAW